MAHQLRTQHATYAASFSSNPSIEFITSWLPTRARSCEDDAAVTSAVRVYTLQQRQWQAHPCMHTVISAEHTDQINYAHLGYAANYALVEIVDFTMLVKQQASIGAAIPSFPPCMCHQSLAGGGSLLRRFPSCQGGKTARRRRQMSGPQPASSAWAPLSMPALAAWLLSRQEKARGGAQWSPAAVAAWKGL